MLLEVTVVAGPGAGNGGGSGGRDGAVLTAAPFPWAELSIAWPSGVPQTSCSGLSLHQALAQRWPGLSFTVSGEPLEALQAGIVPLVNGAVLVAWPDGQPARAVFQDRDGAIAAVLSVCSGPGAGAVFALHRGSYTLGRGQCRIRVADPSLSRHHGTLVVGAHEITLSAAVGSSGFSLRSRNSSPTASAEHVKGTVVLEVGHVVACGSSTLELRFNDPVLPMSGAGPRLLDSAALGALSVPNTTGSTRNRAAMAVAGCLPLLLGLGLALLTGSWMFLAFAAMGAMAVLVPLFGGLKRRRTFRSAVEAAAWQDASRRFRTFPDAGTLMVAARAGPGPPWPAPSGAQAALRLGTATQAAAIEVAPADAGFSAPQLQGLPLCVGLTNEPVTVSGPARAVVATLNYVLMQLDAAAIPAVLLGPAETVPLAARFLPRTLLATSAAAASHALASLRGPAGDGTETHPAVLLLVDEPAAAWLDTNPGLRVVHFAVRAPAGPGTNTGTIQARLSRPVPDPSGSGFPSGVPSGGCAAAAPPRTAAHRRGAATTPATVELRTAGNRLVGSCAGREFVPDGVPPTVFDAYARRRALSVAGQPRPGSGSRTGQHGDPGFASKAEPAVQGDLAPNSLPLAELCTVDSLMLQWQLSSGGPLLPVPLGQSTAGPVMFDFRRDGPHLLLGGTTGSGKSELLRTLAGSLAAAHSPADLQFVFIDFKGGAGLGSLCRLPHTTSLITDLGGEGMERTLASLRAELHRREAALAALEAADSDSYRSAARHRVQPSGQDGHAMAHLVVVIDEFRVLVDQFPDAMAELMRIAAVGRSLGIHLVMATQRPQGALNADIRANVTSSICLRVQSTFDSTDVIGTGVAATISVTVPGRAYISKAGAPPQEFQSATLRLSVADSGLIPVVEDAREHLAATPAHEAARGAFASDVGALAKLMAEAWERCSAADPNRRAAPAVVAAGLPAEVELCNPPGKVSLLLGLVDVPHRQSVEPLLWNPELNAHLACVGTPAETSCAVALVAGQLLAANDAATGAAGAAGGSVPRLLYLLDGDGSLGSFSGSPWVGGCVGPNQLRTAAHLVQRLGQAAAGSRQTLVLCISDWGRWAAALRASPWHETEDSIAALVRFGCPNLVAVMGGGRELLTATFLPSVPNRIFLPYGASSESTMLWPRLPGFKPLHGRGAVAGPVNPVVSAGGAEQLHIAQLGNSPSQPPCAAATRGGAAGPKRSVAGTENSAAATLLVTGLPESVSMVQMHEAVSGELPAPGSRDRCETTLVVGLGGDGRQPVRVALAPGTVFPVLGSPGSGKSSFLHALEQLNCGSVRAVRQTGHDPGTLFLDDAASLTSLQLQQARDGLAAGMVLVVAFPWPGPALSSLPLEWGLRTAQQGVVLRPQRSGDGELFGVRLDTAGAEPLGRGVLLDRGPRSWFQFPLPETGPAGDTGHTALRRPGP